MEWWAGDWQLSGAWKCSLEQKPGAFWGELSINIDICIYSYLLADMLKQNIVFLEFIMMILELYISCWPYNYLLLLIDSLFENISMKLFCNLVSSLKNHSPCSLKFCPWATGKVPYEKYSNFYPLSGAQQRCFSNVFLYGKIMKSNTRPHSSLSPLVSNENKNGCVNDTTVLSSGRIVGRSLHSYGPLFKTLRSINSPYGWASIDVGFKKPKLCGYFV